MENMMDEWVGEWVMGDLKTVCGRVKKVKIAFILETTSFETTTSFVKSSFFSGGGGKSPLAEF